MEFLCIALLCFALLYFALLCFTLLCVALLGIASQAMVWLCIALLWFCIHTSKDMCRRKRQAPHGPSQAQVSNQSSEAAQAVQPSTSRPVSVLEVHWPVTNLVTLILGHPTICKGAFQLLNLSLGTMATQIIAIIKLISLAKMLL